MRGSKYVAVIWLLYTVGAEAETDAETEVEPGALSTLLCKPLTGWGQKSVPSVTDYFLFILLLNLKNANFYSLLIIATWTMYHMHIV